MRQNSFKATNWLNQTSSNRGSAFAISEGEKLSSDETINSFQPAGFFTPGWSGESLISKNGVKVKKILMKLWSDGIHQFSGLSQANRSLQNLIFEQFKNHCEENKSKIDRIYLDSSSLLFKEICLPMSKMNPVIADFVKISSFKSVTLYLYKVKFLSKLSDCLDLELDESKIKNPSYFFQKIFKATTQNNIVISSLQKNAYSWYRPSNNINLKITPILRVLESISITELMKITSFSNYIKTQKVDYPHSISHQEFGKLINELIIHFPKWVNDNNKHTSSKKLEVLSVNFSGQHVSSLSQSHWLAQNSSDPRSWKQLLFPNFSLHKKNDPYIKFCHELQFLSFLINISKIYKRNPVKYIIEVYQEKNELNSSPHQNFGQTSLFESLNKEPSRQMFHRAVLNLPELPKKNPHHYLTSQIISEFKNISDNGFLLILTNQKLFVPSYQDKVKQVLDVANLEAEFNLENLQNKGEVPDYIYIFSKNAKQNKFLEDQGLDNKSSYLSFTFEGQLNQFQLLQVFSKELQNIWINKKSTTPIYQKDLDRNFILKFHQKVVLDGKSLENENKSQDSITHPNFYRNLALNSVTLDHFFKIESNEGNQIVHTERDYLFSSNQYEEKSPYVLIVHTPDYLASSIEIIHSDSLEAKKQQYGEAFYQYYNLTPVYRSLNINIFREYFNSNIGRQIIKLTLGGATTKIKSKIRSLLVPKKLYTPGPVNLDGSIPKSFDLLNFATDSLKSFSIEDLEEKFNNFFTDANQLKSTDAGLALSCLSHIKIKLQHLRTTKNVKQDSLNISDPDFIDKITKLSLYPIYPSNEDAFVEFNSNDKVALYSTVSHFKQSEENGQSYIEIFVQEKKCLSIFSSPNLHQFIYQLLSQFDQFRPADILQTLKVPSAIELDAIVSANQEKTKLFNEFHTKSDQLINSIITNLII